MKTKDEVTQRIQELVSAELDRRVQEASERLPRRCLHNYLHPLDTRRSVGGSPNANLNRITDRHGLPVVQTIGLCLLGSEDPKEWGGTICEEPLDAKRCPLFMPAKGKAEILPDLEADLSNPAWVKDNLPEVYSLMWVSGVERPAIPWWRRFLLWMKVIHVEPVTPPIDVTKLLPSPDDK